MPDSAVRRILGLNLRVRDLDRALAFYTNALKLMLKGAFRREAFLYWGGKDFVGLFSGNRVGWHHVEFLLQAVNASAALQQLQEQGLFTHVRSLGSSTMRDETLKDSVPSGIEIFTPLVSAALVAELADPDGRIIEFVYLPEDYIALEIPGLRAIEIASPQPEVVKSFYQQLGFCSSAEGLLAASGQLLKIHSGPRPEWVRATVAAPDLLEPNTLRDPDGHEWIIHGR